MIPKPNPGRGPNENGAPPQGGTLHAEDLYAVVVALGDSGGCCNLLEHKTATGFYEEQSRGVEVSTHGAHDL